MTGHSSESVLVGKASELTCKRGSREKGSSFPGEIPTDDPGETLSSKVTSTFRFNQSWRHGGKGQ